MRDRRTLPGAQHEVRYARAVAEVRPFRALLYDTSRAGPLEALVAPPFDVVSDQERAEYRARSPYNVVHLTLPDSEAAAADALQEWREQGVLVRDDEPSVWALQQDYVGPDGVARTRTGLVASLRLEPYDRRVVLPHERTHRGPKEGRLRLLRATRTELEPIFLLYEGEPPVAPPQREPDVEADDARLWRIPADGVADVFAQRQLLIADGHHRYETALAFHEEDGSEASAWMMVVLVGTSDPGLTIFPTHRLAERFTLDGVGDPMPDPLAALRHIEELPRERPACVVYAGGETRVAVGEPAQLDPAFVESLGPEGVSYTAFADEAVAAVDEGRAAAAFLLRPTRIQDVFDVARRGEVMPQKSTYFYPKLLSGLLLHPLD
jgi:uncharacterized protein (DUF1015 family)